MQAAAIHHSITKAGGTADGMEAAQPTEALKELLIVYVNEPDIQVLIYQYFQTLYQIFDIIPTLPLPFLFVPVEIASTGPMTVI
jgi:hypothetical protein